MIPLSRWSQMPQGILIKDKNEYQHRQIVFYEMHKGAGPKGPAPCLMSGGYILSGILCDQGVDVLQVGGGAQAVE